MSNYVYQPYPKWITDLEGRRMIVRDHVHHASVIGKNVSPDGTVEEASENTAAAEPASADPPAASEPEPAPVVAEDPVPVVASSKKRERQAQVMAGLLKD